MSPELGFQTETWVRAIVSSDGNEPFFMFRRILCWRQNWRVKTDFDSKFSVHKQFHLGEIILLCSKDHTQDDAMDRTAGEAIQLTIELLE